MTASPWPRQGKCPGGDLDGRGGTCKEGRGLSQSWEQGRPGRLWRYPGQKQSQGAAAQGIPVGLQADGRPQDPELSGAASAQICTSRKNTRGVIPDFASVLVPKAIRAPEMASRVLGDLLACRTLSHVCSGSVPFDHPGGSDRDARPKEEISHCWARICARHVTVTHSVIPRVDPPLTGAEDEAGPPVWEDAICTGGE